MQAYLLVYAVCAVYVALTLGATRLVTSLVGGIFTLVLVGITAALTRNRPEEPVASGQSRRALWVQLTVLLLLVIASLTRRQPLIYYLEGSPIDAFWRAAKATAANAGANNPFILINPLHYFLVPLLLLTAFGASARSLGLRLGYRSWLVSAVICGLLLVLKILAGFSVAAIPGRAILNLLQTGFSEEFLWRGAVQSRIEQLAGSEWAVVLASLAFGLWHTSTNAALGGGLLAGAAEGIIGQSAVGLALGFMFIRTRSLLAPSIVHIVIDL